MKNKKYSVAYAGGVDISVIYATCITSACKKFISTLEEKAKYSLYSKTQGHIRLESTLGVYSDFVIIQI